MLVVLSTGSMRTTCAVGVNALGRRPPAFWPAIGAATRNPIRITASCTWFTMAELFRPPRMKYATVNTAAMKADVVSSQPAAMFSTIAAPLSWLHSTKKLQAQVMSAASPLT